MVKMENSSLLSDEPTRKKRNLPGMPDPDAEVIALSPKSLLATNRFVCEICSKGFQRDQNLQLHKRGHNLPWKLRRQDTGGGEGMTARKRVYVCPESTCLHHDPARALGDLTGIKKHFCRKHGEKKFDCERCPKRYAVRSDCKAHMKTCGTRDYRCDCGTLFSRRDSFVTHRAFCDALARESTDIGSITPAPPPAASSPPRPLTPSTCVLSPVLSSVQSSVELPENPTTSHFQPPPEIAAVPASTATIASTPSTSSNTSSGRVVPYSSRVFASIYNASTSAEQPPALYSGHLPPSDHIPAIDPISLSLSSSLYGSQPLFSSSQSQNNPALSATALLQKAAEMGATSSNSASFLRGMWLAAPPPPCQDNISTMAPTTFSCTPPNIKNFVKLEDDNLVVFGNNEPTTVDFLGLGIGDAGEASSGGFSAFLSSIGGGLDMNPGSAGSKL
ncbi:hypothetical protein ACP275_14G047600 [Erythranthe tilingii]